MFPENRQDALNSLFPLGKERWIKVKYFDQEKAQSILWMPMTDDERVKPYIDKVGFQVVSIGLMDEHKPMASALMDVKSDVIGLLYGVVPEHTLETINNIFRNKIEQLIAHTTKNELSPSEEPYE